MGIEMRHVHINAQKEEITHAKGTSPEINKAITKLAREAKYHVPPFLDY